MNYIDEQIKDSKDYQLQSLIRQYTEFYNECTTNTAGAIIRMALIKAKTECDVRNISYTG
jgi:hypothetical protein